MRRAGRLQEVVKHARFTRIDQLQFPGPEHDEYRVKGESLKFDLQKARRLGQLHLDRHRRPVRDNEEEDEGEEQDDEENSQGQETTEQETNEEMEVEER